MTWDTRGILHTPRSFPIGVAVKPKRPRDRCIPEAKIFVRGGAVCAMKVKQSVRQDKNRQSWTNAYAWHKIFQCQCKNGNCQQQMICPG